MAIKEINIRGEKSRIASKKAHILHAENHALKASALDYYADKIDSFNSMDDAAGKIAGKIVPSAFRTVRKWITDYHKALKDKIPNI